MHQHVRLALATATALSLATGLLALDPAPASASASDPPQETVVPATERTTDVSVVPYRAETRWGRDGAGAEGFFHTMEGRSGLQWTRYSDGETVPVSERHGLTSPWSTGSDALAQKEGRVITLWDAAQGTSRTLEIPEGYGDYGVFGSTVAVHRTVTDENGASIREASLLTPAADGGVETVVVGGLPPGSQVGMPTAADETHMAFLIYVDGQYRTALVDRATGKAEGWTVPTAIGYGHAVLTTEHLVLYSTLDDTLLVVPRDDLSATPVEVELESGAVSPAHHLAAVGDWLVYRRSHATEPVRAVPATGGEAVTLFAKAYPKITKAPSHSAVVVGRTGEDDWGIHRVTEGEDGRPAVTVFKPLPRPDVTIRGISLAHGRLVVTDDSRGRRESWLRDVATTGTPEFGERTLFNNSPVQYEPCPVQDPGCARVHGLADGRIAWLDRGADGQDTIRIDGRNTEGDLSFPAEAGGEITDVSGGHLLHTAPGRQAVYRIGHFDNPVLTRDPGPAALWGDVLWTPDDDPGTVTGYDLAAKKTAATVDTGAGCAPEELQAVGRWLYVDCSGDAPSVVHDREAGTTVAVPDGEALLGDGYLVTHDRASGDLTLTTVTGAAASGRVIGRLPDTGHSQRRVRWTVDEFGGHAAWVDDQGRVHLVPSGAPTGALTAVGAPRKAPEVWAATAEAAPTPLTSVLLSKPADRWTLAVRDAVTGRTVGTSTGGSARGRLEVGWRGLHPGGSRDVFLPDGRYDWTLAVTPADGHGPALTYGGTTVLRGAGKVRHDHAGPRQPDGVGDLVTVSRGGWLTFQHGDGSGGFSGKKGFHGWSNRITPVSFGDLDGDRCNDLLIRMPDGELRGYRPECGEVVGFDTPHTSLGTGWDAYDMLTSPGDLTGDGRADLLARRIATGDIHLFAAEADGTLAPGRKIRSGWTYTKIVGVGDLNGDGHGDLLAHRKDGALFRYDGTGTGLLKSRVLVSAEWGLSYDTVAGVGDITGDGHADIVVRRTDGVLYRNDGRGDGTFTRRTEIGTGWDVYKGLF
ncbi:FG-GAP-like repeat-containing protein [Streptomyces mangrovi]|uniref:FG-GAP-like repeat-containing protein n=1 Tax=Streptomyces mangrovi TaxID=1206892 RepID=UPI00399C9DA2